MRCARIGRGSGFVARGGFCFLPLVGVGGSLLSGVGDCDSCCGIAVVGLCLLPAFAPKGLCLCCESALWGAGSFLAVTLYDFSAVLFCAFLRLDACL